MVHYHFQKGDCIGCIRFLQFFYLKNPPRVGSSATCGCYQGALLVPGNLDNGQMVRREKESNPTELYAMKHYEVQSIANCGTFNNLLTV